MWYCKVKHLDITPKSRIHSQIGNVVSHVSQCARAYHKAAIDFNSASENLTSGLQKAANVLSKDANLKSPLLKVCTCVLRKL
jgi:hypothetical protein